MVLQCVKPNYGQMRRKDLAMKLWRGVGGVRWMEIMPGGIEACIAENNGHTKR